MRSRFFTLSEISVLWLTSGEGYVCFIPFTPSLFLNDDMTALLRAHCKRRGGRLCEGARGKLSLERDSRGTGKSIHTI